MKIKTLSQLFFIVLMATYSGNLFAQSAQSDYLQANNIRASFVSDGSLFKVGDFMGPNNLESTENPITLFQGNLWMGGFDPSGNLKLAAAAYGANGDGDYHPGPLDQNGVPIENAATNFNHVWKVKRSEVLQLIELYESGEPIAAEDVPESLLSWPSLGNPYFLEKMGFTLPDAPQGLAPFFDIDSDGNYDPTDGDYPIVVTSSPNSSIIIPDEFMWMVFNDNTIHTESGGSALQIEIQMMAYAFNCSDNPVINNTIFTSHKLIHRGLENTVGFRFGLWLDPDLGCPNDDYIGCNPSLNTGYVYNADASDGQAGCYCSFIGTSVPTFCDMPPVQSITFLNRPLDNFIYYNNGLDPNIAPQYYNYLNSEWADGTPLTFGGDGYNPGSNDITQHAFPDNPNDQGGWSMITATGVSATEDRRFIMSNSIGTLVPGAIYQIDMAYSVHSAAYADHLQNVDVMENEIPTVQDFYANGFNCSQMDLCNDVACVYPGDANNDEIADIFDYLSVGVAAGHQSLGVNRETINSLWQGHTVTDWTNNFVNNSNHKHSDCTGNGLVDEYDPLIIAQNLGETTPFYIAQPPVPATECTEGEVIVTHNRDTVDIDGPIISRSVWTTIDLGSAEMLVQDIYGIAFRIHFNPEQITFFGSFSSEVNFTDNFIIDQTSNFKLGNIDFETGQIDIALSRADGQNVSGFGELLNFRLLVRDDFTTPNEDGTLEIRYQITDLRAIDFEENVLDFCVQNSSFIVTNVPYDPYSATENEIVNSELSIFPNPTSGLFTIQRQDNLGEDWTIDIFNLQGQLIETNVLAAHQNTKNVRLDVSSGVYLIQISDKKGNHYTEKLFVE